MTCSTFNIHERVCALEKLKTETVANIGHLPVVAYEGPDFSFDKDGQVLVLEDSSDDLVSIDVVRFQNHAAMMPVVPDNPHQLAILTDDEGNGPHSIWVTTGPAAGNRLVRVASMASQNLDSVKITGGTIHNIVPPIPVGSGGTGGATPNAVWTNLSMTEPFILSGSPTYGILDWAQSDNYSRVSGSASAPFQFSFANVMDGKHLYLAFYWGGPVSTVILWPPGIH
jgi:hypothetical protein